MTARRLPALAVALLAALALVACEEAVAPTPTPTPPGDVVAVTPTPEAAASPAPPTPTPPPEPDGEPVSRWEELPPLPAGPRQETSVVALDGEVYVLGGFDGQRNIVPLVEVYDPETQAWRRAADLPVAAHHINAGVLDGRLWVVGFLLGGGFNADGRVFSYDPRADAWQEHDSMPAGTARGASAVAVLDGRIIVAGGYRGGTAVRDVSAYDPAANTWEELPPLPDPRDHVIGEVVDGVLYVIGGRAGSIGAHTASVVAYAPGADAWQQRAPMPTSRAGAAGGVVNGLIVIAGGEGNAGDPSGVFAEVEAYDAGTDSWTVLPSMPLPRHGMGGTGIGDALYIPGGADVQAFGAVATFDRVVLER